jgi:phage pi2 protein 07
MNIFSNIDFPINLVDSTDLQIIWFSYIDNLCRISIASDKTIEKLLRNGNGKIVLNAKSVLLYYDNNDSEEIL